MGYFYALKDTDWSWDDRDEGRAVIVEADTPEDAIRIATELHIEQYPGAGGVTWAVARVDDIGFGDAEWAEDNIPVYEPFKTYHDVAESEGSQIDRLAKFIMTEIPGEPSENEGAIDTAIRWMRSAISAALAPDLAEQGVGGWRTMDGAPKDGIFWAHEFEGQETGVAYFDDERFVFERFATELASNGYAAGYPPSIWHSLPDIPAEPLRAAAPEQEPQGVETGEPVAGAWHRQREKHDGHSRSIRAFFAANPFASNRECSQATGLSVKTVGRHVKKIRAALGDAK